MNLILCHPNDKSAIWLYKQLNINGLNTTLLAVEEILMAKSWTQNITTTTDSFSITTKSGITLTNKNLNFVLNRVQMANAPIWEKADPKEKSYIQSEMTAMLMSWLYDLQQKTKLFNPPNNYNLYGAAFSENEWKKKAIEAEMSISTKSDSDPKHKILVVGEKTIQLQLNKNLAAKAINLSKIVNSPILEIYLNSKDEFVSANSFPAFDNYGQNFVKLITHHINWNQP
jgi:hypothetical protein